MSAVDLLVIGDCNPDLILVGCAPPAFGQAEQLVDDAVLTIGGSASIVACGAARLGLRTALAGSVGDDVFGHFMLDALAERDIDVSTCRVHPGRRTGVTVVLDRGDDRAQLTAPGAIHDLSADDVDLGVASEVRHVHVSSYFLQPRLQPGLPGLLERARAVGATTSLDTNWDPDERWSAGLREALRHLDVFLPNREEAAQVSGERDPVAAARAIAAQGPKTVVVKLGAEGAVAVRGDEVVRSPSPEVDAVDATGAGDSFAAGFIAGIVEDRPLEETMALACACGALSTRGVGGTSAQPDREEALRAAAALAAERA
ncbi:MAG TPA: sugar kinase [Actinomycetota bacterium]|nr:sugar kinase [Actinomycetota bacterium]